MCAVSVAGVVLAAGFSRRLGRPKQTVAIGGETLIERSVRVAQAAGLDPILVVVNAQAAFSERIRAEGCAVVLNGEAAEGLASSIRAGVHALQAVPGLQGAVLMTCDQIGTTPSHLRGLYGEPNRITGSRYGGKNGVPAYFPYASFPELLALRGDTGARDLLRTAHAIEAQELALDLDTEEDVLRARQLFE